MDGIEPECTTGECAIPPLDYEGERIIEIRGLIARLGPLIDPGTVCRICNVDRFDLELLAAVEEELRSQNAKDDQE